jgi:hypothetical protein
VSVGHISLQETSRKKRERNQNCAVDELVELYKLTTLHGGRLLLLLLLLLLLFQGLFLLP